MRSLFARLRTKKRSLPIVATQFILAHGMTAKPTFF